MIRTIDATEYSERTSGVPYYDSRWIYHRRVSEIADILISQHKLTSALELGPYQLPLIVGSDVMDIVDHSLPIHGARFIQHDASKIPWPVDHLYDLFLGLQVLEHLDADQNGARLRSLVGIQRKAFEEICRISRFAIVSLPIDWKMDDPNDCHHMISNEQALSWFLPRVPNRIEIGNDGTRKRLIYIFEEIDSMSVTCPRLLNHS
jgi:hypothetical protein